MCVQEVEDVGQNLRGAMRWLSGKEAACSAGDAGSVLSWEDPLEKGMATHSRILACRIPWTEEPGGLQSMGLKRVSHSVTSNSLQLTPTSLIAQLLKNLPAMQDTLVGFLGWEAPLEKG